jgi:exopolysaccharide biosynthesis polyprenyl glycosylphosphotransferase
MADKHLRIEAQVVGVTPETKCRLDEDRREVSDPGRLPWLLTPAAWFLIDAVLAFIAMEGSYLFSPSFHSGLFDPAQRHLDPHTASVCFGLLTAIVAHALELHNPWPKHELWGMVTRCLTAVAVALALLAAMVFTVFYLRIGRWILGQALLHASLLLVLVRLAIWWHTAERKRRLLVLGAGALAMKLAQLLTAPRLPFKLLAVLDPHSSGAKLPLPPAELERGSRYLWNLSEAQKLPVLEAEVELAALCKQLGVHELVVCVEDTPSNELLQQLMGCIAEGTQVTSFSAFIERHFQYVPVDNIDQVWFLHSNIKLSKPFYSLAKRFLDLLAAVLGLVAGCPILLLAMAAIRLESKGPVLYSQTRLGQWGRPFRIWKLRTMCIGAEAGGARWATKDDPRVTRVGKVLRRSRIDELPQFWNVLRGEMSLVGPRPERPEFVHELAQQIPFYEQRLVVKPGITGWAQINYPYGASVTDALHKLRFDLYYVKHASIALDLQIMIQTIGGIMKGSR